MGGPMNPMGGGMGPGKGGPGGMGGPMGAPMGGPMGGPGMGGMGPGMGQGRGPPSAGGNFGGPGKGGGNMGGQPPQTAGGPEAFKTRICTFFEQGKCTRGDACTFAHGEHELNRSKGGGKGGYGGGGMQPGGTNFGKGAGGPPMQALGGANGVDRSFKTKMCTFFEQGKCTRGAACTFAHDPSELTGGKGGGKGTSPRPFDASKGGGKNGMGKGGSKGFNSMGGNMKQQQLPQQ
eukprot:gnl/MRDRNA2_/MRDRNA2_41873_c0_seq1.p1 gnl/MRDRNA2_/MRDRNA2_41873_c0~~gnl/MRDRNA2_/MRDRNA2_41873_c0_seq1.p1  ORF type:complete len:273 (+),score=55.54 gnl/MRDRNA2_/MRDRNA2_41873_c0_seq1:119-820(+)